MMFFVLFAALHVGGQPTAWSSVAGNRMIEYRWSRPANNSCDIEFRTNGSKQRVSAGPYTFTMFVESYSLPDQARRTERSIGSPLRREAEMRIFLPGAGVRHIDSCIGIRDIILVNSPRPVVEDNHDSAVGQQTHPK